MSSKKDLQARWRVFFGEDLSCQRENLGGGVQAEYLCEMPDLFRVGWPGGERLHREEMLGHRSTAEHIDVCDHAALGQTVAEPTEGFLDARAVEYGQRIAHAASIS